MKEKLKAEIGKITWQQAAIAVLVNAALLEFGPGMLTVLQDVAAVILGAACWIIDLGTKLLTGAVTLLVKAVLIAAGLYLASIAGTYVVTYIRERMKK